jgi:putative nucleotidyltransferase with HDIG domain
MQEIPKKVSEIISPVYLVGGSVRDTILNREVNDWDFCTPKTPDEIELAFRNTGRKVWTAGKKFGTIASKVQLDDGVFTKVEITTFRTEVYTEGSRKPQVQFAEHLEADLSRRDFTINAIAMRNGKLIDPFGGISDIEEGIIKAVGNPRQRFKEDPLRLMRAARFASQLGFVIEGNTFEKMIERSHSILTISKERVMDEMNKILLSKNPRVGLEILMRTGIMRFVIPELSLQYKYNQNSCYHALDLWEHTIRVVEEVPQDLVLRWSALLHDIGKPFTRTENVKTGYSNYIKHDILGADIVDKLAVHLKWSK